MKGKLLWYSILVSISIGIDFAVVKSGLIYQITSAVSWAYHLPAWFIFWGLCLLIFRNFWFSIAAVTMGSVLEDFVYILVDRIIKGEAIYPVYCHEWLRDFLGELMGLIFGSNWLGFPSSYFICTGIAVMMVLIGNLIRKRRS